MRIFLAVALALATGMRIGVAGSFTFEHENCLGTSLDLRISASSESAAKAAEAAVLSEIDRVAGIVSTYDPTSEFSRWLGTRGTAEKISPDLLAVLHLFDRWTARSQGAFNAGAGVVIDVWKNASKRGRMPAAAELAAATKVAQAPHWKLDDKTGAATHLDSSPLTLDAAAKGYIIDRACESALRIDGVSGVLVNIGGDLAMRGDVSGTVDISDPRDAAENAPSMARVALRDRAVATSGDYRRGFTIGTRRVSHIVDPRTGQPADRVISATAVARDAADADALATIFSVLKPEESARLSSGLPGVEYLLVLADGRRVESRGWKTLVAAEEPSEGILAAPAAGGEEAGLWDPSFKLDVSFEIATIQGVRVRRPFVAVWIEDADKYPVRTLALWFHGNRWLPDLRSWSRGDELRALAEGTDLTKTISSATRGPGKYTVEWDGRDNAGKLVKAGKYTVYIEAAREHGTHQLMRQEIDFSGAPQKMDLSGNVEISSASLDYHKVSPTP